MQRQLAIVASALGNDVRAAAAGARQMGFAAMLFDAYGAGVNIPDLSTSGRREFRHVVSSQNVSLLGLQAALGPKGFGPGADVDRLLARLDSAMESAAGLGAPLLCLDLGPLPPSDEPAPKPKPTVTPEMAGLLILPSAPAAPARPAPQALPPPDPGFVAQVDAAMLELGQRADRYGVTVAMRSDLASFGALARAIGAARCPWFGVDFDSVAGLRDEWTTGEIFARLGPLVRHVRARDAVRGQDRRTQAAVVGKGSVDWGEVVGLLDEAGYPGALTLDPMELSDRPAAARAGAEFLRALA